VTLVNEPQYRRLCAVLGRDDLATDPRFSDFAKRSDSADILIAEVRAALLTKTTVEWLAALHAADIIAERILDPGEWLADPHVTAIHSAVKVETPGVGSVYAARTPGAVGLVEDTQSPSPDLGQHNREVLRDNGYAEAEIDALCKVGAVVQP
jgi:crotonobetainyl-CoA:carnitine CoA-transferase CaiB-like acyl-CoA transferase